MPRMSEDLIDTHEDAALGAIILLELLGVAAAVGLVAFRKADSMPRWFVPGLLILALVAVAWVGWTSYIGGQISHPEARADFVIEAES